MGGPTVGIIDPFHPAVLAIIETALPAGWRLSVTSGPTAEERAAAMAAAEVLFVMATPVPASLIAAAPRLAFIQKMGAGVDRIDLDACAARGIGVARLQAGNAIPVAEHTLLLMLAACRRLPYLDRQTRAGAWDKEAARGVSRQIHGKTVGIVGFGAIGRAVARLLAPFGAELIYYDPRRAKPADEQALSAGYRPLDELLAASDIVTLHLPLLPQTAGIIDAGRIAAMKRGAILVNAARGGLVDEAALHRALVEGHLFAAGIDVFEKEPPVGSPLLALDQTVVTPHSAGGTIDNFASVARRSVRNAQTVLSGGELPAGEVIVAVRRRSPDGPQASVRTE